MAYTNTIPVPPRRNRDWLQPQTTLTRSPNPTQHFYLGPIQK